VLIFEAITVPPAVVLRKVDGNHDKFVMLGNKKVYILLVVGGDVLVLFAVVVLWVLLLNVILLNVVEFMAIPEEAEAVVVVPIVPYLNSMRLDVS
jgi:hypothetical protein